MCPHVEPFWSSAGSIPDTVFFFNRIVPEFCPFFIEAEYAIEEMYDGFFDQFPTMDI